MPNEFTRRKAVTTLAVGSVAAVACTGRGEHHPVKHTQVQREIPMESPILSEQALPQMGPMPTADPFLFCVHHCDDYPKGNAQYGPSVPLTGRQIGQDFANRDGWNMYHGDRVPGFPRHPHRGFETVTIVKSGLIDHADSLGSAARYGDGDVQWLTAGDGINHSEMFPLINASAKNPTDFFQIWLNLPARSKRVTPYFTMFWDNSVPVHKEKDQAGHETVVRVISGNYYRERPPSPPPNSWASAPGASVGMLTISMASNAHWNLPPGSSGLNRSLYVVQGAVSAGGGTGKSRWRYVLKSDRALTLKAGKKGATLLLLEGKPIGEPVAQHGPFVMNTQEEIAQAFADYRKTQFGGWPWNSSEPTHGGDRLRFARFADGRTDTPT